MNHSFHLKHKWVSTSYQQQRKWDPPEESKSGNDKKGPNTYWLKQYELFRVFLGLFLLGLHLFFLLGVGNIVFFSFAFEYLVKFWSCWSEFPILHRLYSFTPFSCWILTHDVNCQEQIGYLPSSWGPLFPFELILGHSPSKMQLGRVGMWIWQQDMAWCHLASADNWIGQTHLLFVIQSITWGKNPLGWCTW